MPDLLISLYVGGVVDFSPQKLDRKFLPLCFRLFKSHRIGWNHQKQSHKPVLNAYLRAIHPTTSLLLTLCTTVSLFHHPAYFSRDTIEADSWSWVANYVRLSPFQAQLWSNGMKKQDQTARLKIILPFRSLLFAASLCLFLSLLLPPPVLPALPPASLYIHFLVSLCFPCSSLRRQRSRGICKSLLLRKLHPA